MAISLFLNGMDGQLGMAFMLRTISMTLAVLAAGAPTAVAQTVVVTMEDCRNLVAYTQPPGVEYTPGVDINGNPVASADLNGGYDIKPPEEVTFDVKVDPRDFLGGPEADASAASSAVLAADKATAAVSAAQSAATAAASAADEAATVADTLAADTTAKQTAAQAAQAAADADPLNKTLKAAAETAAADYNAAKALSDSAAADAATIASLSTKAQSTAAAADAAATTKEKASLAAQAAATANNAAEAAITSAGDDVGKAALKTAGESAQTSAVSAADAAVASADANAARDSAHASANRVGQFLGEANIGKVTVRGTQVFFNGRPVGDSAQHAIAEECAKRLRAAGQ